MPSLDPVLARILELDKKYLETTQIPVVTVSATYKEDLKELFNQTFDESIPDVVFSRAHYSMALAVTAAAWGDKINHQLAWSIDPTNYVTRDQWSKIQLTELIGKTLARQPLLKKLKDFVDRFGRNSLPILKSITPSLLYLTEHVNRPIVSLHIAAGNILAEQGKQVLQVVTDPHVRYDYLNHADLPNIHFCVFDQKTKVEFLEKAALAGKQVDPTKIIVTGPPIDPRIIAKRSRKKIWQSGPLKLCLTTGGLGTNKQEIELILRSILTELRKKSSKFELLVYAATQADIHQLVKDLAREYRVAVGEPDDHTKHLRVIYHPQIVDANELLLQYGFPWADGFITKPSGDMAYDAAAAGCFLLTLKEWGEWEHNIRQVFEERLISRPAQPTAFVPQLQALMSPVDEQKSWITLAMEAAQKLDPVFLRGSETILKTAKKLDRHTNL